MATQFKLSRETPSLAKLALHSALGPAAVGDSGLARDLSTDATGCYSQSQVQPILPPLTLAFRVRVTSNHAD